MPSSRFALRCDFAPAPVDRPARQSFPPFLATRGRHVLLRLLLRRRDHLHSVFEDFGHSHIHSLSLLHGAFRDSLQGNQLDQFINLFLCLRNGYTHILYALLRKQSHNSGTSVHNLKDGQGDSLFHCTFRDSFWWNDWNNAQNLFWTQFRPRSPR